MKNNSSEGKNFAELERVEDKYIIDLADLPAIKSEVEKYLKPAYPETTTKYVLIKTTYLDSPNIDFFKYHTYGHRERMKVRIRKYGPNGVWQNDAYFLEIKEKDSDDVRKYRIQLDEKNLKIVKQGLELKYSDELLKLNEPLYTHTDLKRYIEKYNKIVLKNDLTPILSVNYKRLAYGKDDMRVTIDTDLGYKAERTMPLSTALKIKKAVDWKEAKQYGKKYGPKQNAILEIKHNRNTLPPWLQNLLDSRKLEPIKFSKYVYSAFNILSDITGDR
jgi:hypothetical protein